MKKCPKCGKEYSDDFASCPFDLQPLQSIGSPPNQTAPPVFPQGNTQEIIDNEHLKMLAIGHYVFAGLALAGLLFLCLHATIVTAVFSSHAIRKSASPPPEFLPVFFIFFYLIAGGLITVSGVLNLLSGNFLRGRVHRTFSLVVAGLNCLHIPFGTALGIFTIMVLTRPSVREQYKS